LCRLKSGESYCSALSCTDFDDVIDFLDAFDDIGLHPPFRTSRNSSCRDEEILALSYVKPPCGSRQNSVESFLLDCLWRENDIFHNGKSIPSRCSMFDTSSWISTPMSNAVAIETTVQENNVFPTVALPQESKHSDKRKQNVERTFTKIYTSDGFRNTDVLCGKGERINRHLGNKLFQKEKESHQARYL